jgi:hypothetical protein
MFARAQDGFWDRVTGPGSPLRNIALAATGDLWAVDVDGTPWHRAEAGWERVPAAFGVTPAAPAAVFSAVAAGPDGTVMGVTADHRLGRWNPAARFWTAMISQVVLVAVGRSEWWTVAADGESCTGSNGPWRSFRARGPCLSAWRRPPTAPCWRLRLTASWNAGQEPRGRTCRTPPARSCWSGA